MICTVCGKTWHEKGETKVDPIVSTNVTLWDLIITLVHIGERSKGGKDHAP